LIGEGKKLHTCGEGMTTTVEKLTARVGADRRDGRSCRAGNHRRYYCGRRSLSSSIAAKLFSSRV